MTTKVKEDELSITDQIALFEGLRDIGARLAPRYANRWKVDIEVVKDYAADSVSDVFESLISGDAVAIGGKAAFKMVSAGIARYRYNSRKAVQLTDTDAKRTDMNNLAGLDLTGLSETDRISLANRYTMGEVEDLDKADAVLNAVKLASSPPIRIQGVNKTTSGYGTAEFTLKTVHSAENALIRTIEEEALETAMSDDANIPDFRVGIDQRTTDRFIALAAVLSTHPVTYREGSGTLDDPWHLVEKVFPTTFSDIPQEGYKEPVYRVRYGLGKMVSQRTVRTSEVVERSRIVVDGINSDNADKESGRRVLNKWARNVAIAADRAKQEELSNTGNYRDCHETPEFRTYPEHSDLADPNAYNRTFRSEAVPTAEMVTEARKAYDLALIGLRDAKGDTLDEAGNMLKESEVPEARKLVLSTRKAWNRVNPLNRD